MTTKHSFAIVTFVMGLLLCLLIPQAMAQEATVEANPISIVTVEAPNTTTVEDGGVVINVEAPAEVPSPVDAAPVPWWAVIGASLVALVVVVGGLLRAADTFVQATFKDPFKVTVAEQLGGSVPGPIVDKLNDTLAAAIGLIGTLQKALNEATDKQPYVLKATPTTPYAPTTGTSLATDLTLPKPDTLPNRPSSEGGASPTGPGAFPPSGV